MNALRLILLGTALLTATATLPLPEASALANTCAVGPGDGACFFPCVTGVVTVVANGGSGGAIISASCSPFFPPISCFAPPFRTCIATGPQPPTGRGVCTLDDLDDPPFPDATGACSG